MNYLELAKMQLQAIDGTHPSTEIQVRALVAIADALVALVELPAGEEQTIARQNGKTSQLADVLEQLQDENAKLREMVRHLYTCMERQEPDGSLLCANCPYENESNECDYELRMEELGVK